MDDAGLLNEDNILYTARPHTIGGREGRSRSDDGHLQIRLDRPGAQGKGTNPEQLFAAGWSGCFGGAMAVAARNRKLTLPADTRIDAEVDLRQGQSGYSLAARLQIHVPRIDPAIAQEIVDEAHEICPYSKATRGNIDVSINLV